MNAEANNTIDKVRKLQRKLYQVAKMNKERRFHALYDKIYRKDVLKRAWKEVKENNGSGGIDNIRIEEVEEFGENSIIAEIGKELMNNEYTPKPVKRIYIPKKDGSKRALGIPTIKDRIIQTATKIVIEPIFEADFKESSFGFRPKRSAHDALEVIRETCNKGNCWVLEADIVKYFDTINQEKLMVLIEQRISDRRVLKLIRKWLKSGIMDKGMYIESEIGSPQGGVISPLLANIYLDYLDTLWEKYYKHLGKLVRYADDFVIISRSSKDINHAYKAIEKIFGILELKLHPEKTRIINLWGGKDGFDFLGFQHRMSHIKKKNGDKYWTMTQVPSSRAMNSMRQKIKRVLKRSVLNSEMYDLVEILNRKLIGFRNYYKLQYAAIKLKKIDWYVNKRFTIWYNNKINRRPRHGNIGEVVSMINGMGLERLAF